MLAYKRYGHMAKKFTHCKRCMDVYTLLDS